MVSSSVTLIVLLIVLVPLFVTFTFELVLDPALRELEKLLANTPVRLLAEPWYWPLC